MISIASPKLSIGIPVYNAARYLRQALDSLLAQTYEDFELIISDNASDDATEAICREYVSRDNRVKYHRHDTNRGAIWNCNHTVQLAQGEYFKWAAYDDLHHETFLQKCVEILDAQPDVVWCHSLTSHIDATGNTIPGSEDPNIPDEQHAHSLLFTENGLPQQTRASATVSERFTGVLMGTTWCADSFGLIRTETLRKTRLLLPCYGSEKVLFGELSLLGKYAEIPEVLFLERIHAEASASLRTASAQQGFVLGTQRRRRFTSTRWNLLAGHFGAICRAPVSFAQKTKCFTTLFRYVCQFRKWKRVLGQMVLRVGVGAEKRTQHEISQTSPQPVNTTSTI